MRIDAGEDDLQKIRPHRQEPDIRQLASVLCRIVSTKTPRHAANLGSRHSRRIGGADPCESKFPANNRVGSVAPSVCEISPLLGSCLCLGSSHYLSRMIIIRCRNASRLCMPARAVPPLRWASIQYRGIPEWRLARECLFCDVD
jgi:hypothetical protein